MADEKTIKFRGDNKELLNSIREIDEATRNAFTGMARAALSSSDDYSTVTESLEEQIKSLKEKIRLEKEIKTIQADRQFQSSIEFGGEREIKDATSARSAAISEAAAASREGNLQVKILADILETLKRSASKEIGFDEAAVREKLDDYETGKLDKGSLSVEERTKMAMQWDQLNRGGGGEDGAPEGNKPMGFWKTAAAVATGEAVQRFLSGTFHRLNNAAGAAVTASSGDEAMWDIIGEVPFMGAAGAAGKRSLSEQKRLLQSKYSLGASTGILDINGGTNYGQDQADMAALALRVAKSSRLSEHLGDRAENVIALSKGYSLDESKVLDIERNRRLSGDMSPMRLIDTLKNSGFKGVGENGSFVRIEELLEQGNKLVQEQTSFLEQVDYGSTVSLMSAFDKIGGSFGDDPRKAERMASVNSGLTSPANDYQQAMRYSVLSKLKPGANIWDMQMMQERGMYEPGYLSGMMKQLTTGVDPVSAKLMMKTNMPNLSREAIEKLYEGFMKDSSVFDTVKSDEELKKMLELRGGESKVAEDERKRGGDFIDPLSKKEAAMTNAFASGIIKGAAEAGAQLSQAITDGVQVLAQVLKDAISGKDSSSSGNIKIRKDDYSDSDILKILQQTSKATGSPATWQIENTIYHLDKTMTKLESHLNPSNTARN